MRWRESGTRPNDTTAQLRTRRSRPSCISPAWIRVSSVSFINNHVSVLNLPDRRGPGRMARSVSVGHGVIWRGMKRRKGPGARADPRAKRVLSLFGSRSNIRRVILGVVRCHQSVGTRRRTMRSAWGGGSNSVEHLARFQCKSGLVGGQASPRPPLHGPWTLDQPQTSPREVNLISRSVKRRHALHASPFGNQVPYSLASCQNTQTMLRSARTRVKPPWPPHCGSGERPSRRGVPPRWQGCSARCTGGD